MGAPAQEMKAVFATIKRPEYPLMVAGGIGGPFLKMLVTPLRNALTLAARDQTTSLVGIYGQVFSKGIAGGYAGGIYPAIAACPQFITLGPAFHVYKSFSGLYPAMFLASFTESMINFGAETKNAQLAANVKGAGIPAARLQNPLIPYGPGISIHITRNCFATAGLRLFKDPWTVLFEKIAGRKCATATLAGDLMGNICGACTSFVFHQLYAYTVTTPELWDKSAGGQRQMIKQYLWNQYTVTNNGSTRVSRIMIRDVGLRSIYIGVVFTGFLNIERACLSLWPNSWPR